MNENGIMEIWIGLFFLDKKGKLLCYSYKQLFSLIIELTEISIYISIFFFIKTLNNIERRNLKLNKISLKPWEEQNSN